ncbi:MAG: chemotaxis protein CheX [Planctomycetota bacterium]|jgi:hypothetical protein
MCNELDEVLYRAAEDSVASLAFMLLMQPERPDPTREHPDDRAWAAEAGFAGGVNGKVTLVADDRVVAELAEHMLCLPRESGNRKRDALRELLRVICGKLLPELAAGENRCRIHEPRVLQHSATAQALADRPAAAGARLELADGALELALFIDRYCANGRSVVPVAAARR